LGQRIGPVVFAQATGLIELPCEIVTRVSSDPHADLMHELSHPSLLLRPDMGLFGAATVVFRLTETGIKALGTSGAGTLRPFVSIGGLKALSNGLPGRHTAVL